MVLIRNSLMLLSLFSTFLLCATPACATPVALTDQELTDVSGQGLVTVDNTSLNGFNFSTITLNSDITLNANLKNIVLGQYTNASNNGTGADINMSLVQFGTSAGTAAQQTVEITNPYIQFVYNNAGGPGNNQVVGMRVGFQGIAGNVGLLMNTLSGSLQVDDGSGNLYSSNGYRSTTACAGTTCIPLSQIGGVVAGNASGPSRDFWISMLSQAVQFPGQPGMTQPSLAQPGVWMNWTDRLTAQNLTGTVAANAFGQLLASLHH